MGRPCTENVHPPAAILCPPPTKFVQGMPHFCAGVLYNPQRCKGLGQAAPFLKTFLLREIPIFVFLSDFFLGFLNRFSEAWENESLRKDALGVATGIFNGDERENSEFNR